jgi:hypothetical protein
LTLYPDARGRGEEVGALPRADDTDTVFAVPRLALESSESVRGSSVSPLIAPTSWSPSHEIKHRMNTPALAIKFVQVK